MYSFFSLTAFKIQKTSLFLVFSSFIVICLHMNFYLFVCLPYLGCIEFPELEDSNLSSILSHYSFKYCFCPFLFLLSNIPITHILYLCNCPIVLGILFWLFLPPVFLFVCFDWFLVLELFSYPQAQKFFLQPCSAY